MKTDRPGGDSASRESMSRDSIAMLLTAPQPAAIAVIRLSGPAVKTFAADHLSKPLSIGRCVHCDLRQRDETIDDIVAVLVDDFCVDLNLHGGVWVTEAALRLAEESGFRVASWDAETPCAVDARSAIDAEVAAVLPCASTRPALAVLLAQSTAWGRLLAAPDRVAINRALADRTIERILTPPTVAIVGAPNVGKSTLINRLAGQARSITADVAGTTRDYVTAPANIAGLIVNLIDTPGLRSTDDVIEAEAIRRSADVIAAADLMIDLRDATQPGNSLAEGQRGSIIVWNKCDRAAAPTNAGIAISAATGEGIAALSQQILNALGIDDLHSNHARCWTHRQRAILDKVHTIQVD